MLSEYFALVIFGTTLVLGYNTYPYDTLAVDRTYPSYREELLVVGKWVSEITVSRQTGKVYYLGLGLHAFDRVTYETQTIVSQDKEDIVQTMAADYSEKKIYLGCNTGLKIYHEDSGVIEDVPDIRENIQRLFVTRKGSIYAVIWPEMELYKYENVTSDGINLNITVNGEFVLDANDNIYYRSQVDKYGDQTVTKILLNGETHPRTYLDSNYLKHLAVDSAGRVYALHLNCLYRLKPDDYNTEYVMYFDLDPRGYMCFDNNNDLLLATPYRVIATYIRHILWKFDTKSEHNIQHSLQ